MAKNNYWFLGDVGIELFKIRSWEMRLPDDGRLTLSSFPVRGKAVTMHWAQNIATWTGPWLRPKPSDWRP